MQPEQDAANRALPTQSFMELLSAKAGVPVEAGGIHRALQSQFGDDASAKTLKALGMLKDFAAKAQAQGGIAAAAGGMFSNALAAAEGSGMVRPHPLPCSCPTATCCPCSSGCAPCAPAATAHCRWGTCICHLA